MREFRNFFRPRPEAKAEQAAEGEGLGGYIPKAEVLKAKFDKKFTRENKETTEAIYTQAKRVDRLLFGTMFPFMGSGGFGRKGSAMSVEGRTAIRETQPIRDQLASRFGKVAVRLQSQIKEIETSVPADLLARADEVSARPLPRFDSIDQYESYIESSAADVMRALSTLVIAKGTGDGTALSISQDDPVTTIRSFYISYKIDREFWEAFAATARTTDKEVISNGMFEQREQVEKLVVSGITAPFERAFSPGGRAEFEVGFDNSAFGRNDSLDVFGNKTVDAAPEGFADSKGYFAELGMTLEEVKQMGGNKEKDFQKEIKSSYYKQAKIYFPDANRGDPAALERMKKINLAYEVLSDREKRARYLTEK